MALIQLEGDDLRQARKHQKGARRLFRKLCAGRRVEMNLLTTVEMYSFMSPSLKRRYAFGKVKLHGH